VNTVPPQWGGATADVFVTGSHAASVSPELLAQAESINDPRTTALEGFTMLDNLVLAITVGKRNVCAPGRRLPQKLRAAFIDDGASEDA
jgi:hypothetical protein